MQKYSDVVLDKNGKGIAGATVTVTTYPDSLAATIYAADGGPAVSSVVTDNAGRFSFYAANGHYSITVSGQGITPFTYNDVVLFDPLDQGAASVRNGSESVASELGALQLSDYAALRSYAGNRKSVYVTGYLATVSPSGIAGMFIRDDSDTTSTDNGGTIIVTTNGRRWKRANANGVNAEWFGLNVSATASVNTAALNAAAQAVRRDGDGYQTAASGRIRIAAGVYKINGTINLYNGTYLDGESAGGVILEQNNALVTTIKNVDIATGIDQSLTIKRIVVKYLAPSTAAGTYGIEIASTTAISPVLEDVTVFNANGGFNFKLTINLAMRRCYAINCYLNGYDFTNVSGAHNSGASIDACYAAGCGQYGFSGTLIGSTLSGVCADRCATGFSMTLKISTLAGSTEFCTNFGAVLGGYSSSVQLYVVTALNAISGIYCSDANDMVFATPKVEWGGGGSGYGLQVDVATCNRLTLISPQIAAFGSTSKYNDTTKITFVGEFAPIVKSPNGTAYQIAVSNAGAVSATLA